MGQDYFSEPVDWCTPGKRRRVTTRGFDRWMALHPDPRRHDVPGIFPDSLKPAAIEVAAWMAQLGKFRSVNGLILWGPIGTGKTSLAVGALLGLAEDAFGVKPPRRWEVWNDATDPAGSDCAVPCQYLPFDEFVSTVTPYENRPEGGGPTRSEKIFRDAAAIVLDDVGVKPFTEHREDWFMRFMNWSAREVFGALVVTTNQPPSSWHGRFGERIQDRLVEAKRFKVVRVDGTTFRSQ